MKRHFTLGHYDWVDSVPQFNVGPTMTVPIVYQPQGTNLVEKGDAAISHLQCPQRRSGRQTHLAQQHALGALPDAGPRLV